MFSFEPINDPFHDPQLEDLWLFDPEHKDNSENDTGNKDNSQKDAQEQLGDALSGTSIPKKNLPSHTLYPAYGETHTIPQELELSHMPRGGISYPPRDLYNISHFTPNINLGPFPSFLSPDVAPFPINIAKPLQGREKIVEPTQDNTMAGFKSNPDIKRKRKRTIDLTEDRNVAKKQTREEEMENLREKNQKLTRENEALKVINTKFASLNQKLDLENGQLRVEIGEKDCVIEELLSLIGRLQDKPQEHPQGLPIDTPQAPFYNTDNQIGLFMSEKGPGSNNYPRHTNSVNDQAKIQSLSPTTGSSVNFFQNRNDLGEIAPVFTHKL